MKVLYFSLLLYDFSIIFPICQVDGNERKVLFVSIYLNRDFLNETLKLLYFFFVVKYNVIDNI